MKPSPQRKIVRLQNYDYSEQGYYFVTICTERRKHLFGHITGDDPVAPPKMILNAIGQMVESIWWEMPDHYPGIGIDEFVVMPNHVHAIIELSGRAQGPAPTLSLSDIVHRFKSHTTARYRDGVKNNGWPIFSGRLWQRSYYDHVIRNEKSLQAIREYIFYNPVMWPDDPENPDRTTPPNPESSPDITPL